MAKTPKPYRILTNHAKGLEAEVCRALAQGYQLHGDLVVQGSMFCQAVVYPAVPAAPVAPPPAADRPQVTKIAGTLQVPAVWRQLLVLGSFNLMEHPPEKFAGGLGSPDADRAHAFDPTPYREDERVVVLKDETREIEVLLWLNSDGEGYWAEWGVLEADGRGDYGDLDLVEGMQCDDLKATEVTLRCADGRVLSLTREFVKAPKKTGRK